MPSRNYKNIVPRITKNLKKIFLCFYKKSRSLDSGLLVKHLKWYEEISILYLLSEVP